MVFLERSRVPSVSSAATQETGTGRTRCRARWEQRKLRGEMGRVQVLAPSHPSRPALGSHFISLCLRSLARAWGGKHCHPWSCREARGAAVQGAQKTMERRRGP